MNYLFCKLNSAELALALKWFETYEREVPSNVTEADKELVETLKRFVPDQVKEEVS